MHSPLFVLTSDTDWASDACITDLADVAASFGIRPVFMATHASSALEQLHAAGKIEIGLHPNFLPGSDHGATDEQVIRFVSSLYPQATTFRCHSFVDSSRIALAMKAAGFKYDSNLCLNLQPNLVPLLHASGLLRFPVFWEDDVHWMNGQAWDLTDAFFAKFLSPGLKILNVHAANFALNVDGEATYRSRMGLHKTISASELDGVRGRGPGVRTFVIDLLRRITDAGHRFYTLDELYKMFSPTLSAGHEDAGRETVHTESEHSAYWQTSPEARQRMLKESYAQRNALDPYATSRDHNARELEIEAISRYLPKGKIVDLGCGNGYTLNSIAKKLTDRDLTGVDFSEPLIEGAKTLAKGLDPEPVFVCGDAVAHIRATPSESLDGVITERFLLNLPDLATQKSVISEIGRTLRPGGRLLMCEGSRDGFAALNKLRAMLGLDVILETSGDNLSALRFDDDVIENYIQTEVGLRLVEKVGFSFFFAVSRALHPKLVYPQSPRFSAPINELAANLQKMLPMTPGVGTNVLWIFEKA